MCLDSVFRVFLSARINIDVFVVFGGLLKNIKNFIFSYLHLIKKNFNKCNSSCMIVFIVLQGLENIVANLPPAEVLSD